MQTQTPSNRSLPPSSDGGNNFLVAIGLFLAEHGYNTAFSGCGHFSVMCQDSRFTMAGPCRIIFSLKNEHVLYAVVGDSLIAFEEINIDLFDPESFDKILALVKRYDQ